jgi:hypothetical protein
MPDFRTASRWSILPGVLIFGTALVFHRPAAAVPAFAQQTGRNCAACHVGGFGPQLTPFGRQFKIGGYTLRLQKSIPVSAMAVASYVHTKRAQEEPPTEDSKTNNNTSFDQGSIFLAGGMGSHLGGFGQFTYSGADEAWSWDNLDLRVVNAGKLAGKDMVYGLTVNNNPTITDPWNTLSGWGYPYTGSDFAPGPDIAPLISGAFAQEALGVTGYAWIDSKFYLEAGGYGTPSRGTLRFVGADPDDPGKIHGIAPYGRAAVQTEVGGGTFEVGAFALNAALFPGRDRSTEASDRYTDLGLDTSWTRPLKSGTLTFNARYTHEKQSLDATCLLGMADGSIDHGPLSGCANNTLDEVRADASYYWHNLIGVTVSPFTLTGSSNPSIYPDYRTFKPNSSGVEFQIDGTPWGNGKSPLGLRFNMRVGAQYTLYTRFNGARSDYDNSGRSAAANNTLRLFTWVAF